MAQERRQLIVPADISRSRSGAFGLRSLGAKSWRRNFRRRISRSMGTSPVRSRRLAPQRARAAETEGDELRPPADTPNSVPLLDELSALADPCLRW